MNILVMAKDFWNNHYILKPLLEGAFAKIGRQRTQIQFCQDTLLGGMADVFNPCVDRDGNRACRRMMDRVEGTFRKGRAFLAENAWEEIETRVLAGLNLPMGWCRADVRAEFRVKETNFDPLSEKRGAADGPGGGRKAFGREAARNIPTIRRQCPEDFDARARCLGTVA